MMGACGRLGVALGLALVAGACSQGSEAPVAEVAEPAAATAADVARKLIIAGLPLEDLEEFTAETDPNAMLGRPGGYISKVNFVDGRHRDNALADTSTIEVFESDKEALERLAYIEEVTSGAPFMQQYMVQHGNILLRLDRTVLPDQATAYEAELTSL